MWHGTRVETTCAATSSTVIMCPRRSRSFPQEGASFAIRTMAEPSSVIAGVRRAILSAGSEPARYSREAVGRDYRRPDGAGPSAGAPLDSFGVVALLLAGIGLYGVLSYGVARRTNEIGIRKALGAQHGTVMVMILRETGVLLVTGLVTGAALSAAGMRMIASRLYGLAPTDPLAFMAAIAVLIGVALIAAGLPALPGIASRSTRCAAIRMRGRGLLFIPQGDHLIDARCTAGGNETRQSRHAQQNQRYRAKSRDIIGPEAVKQAGHRPRRDRRQD